MAAKKTSQKKTTKSAAAKAKRPAKASASKKTSGKSKAKSNSTPKKATTGKSAKSTGAKLSTTASRQPKSNSRAAAASGKANRNRSALKSRSSASKSSPKSAVPKDAPWEDQDELPKTKLTDKQLEEFKNLLLAKRRELTGDVRNLTQDALGRNRQDASGDLSSMPIHMADLGSDNWEQEFTLGLIANEQQLVREIDQALARIEDRTYGICMGTGKPIKLARLRAKPWAKYCIEYARQRELGRV